MLAKDEAAADGLKVGAKWTKEARKEEGEFEEAAIRRGVTERNDFETRVKSMLSGRELSLKGL